MLSIIINFLSSTVGKYALIGLAVVGVILYFNMKIWGLEGDIEDLTLDIKRAELNLDTAKSNLSKCVTANDTNGVVIGEFEKDISVLKQNHSVSIKGKNKVILRLKSVIKELQVTVIYPEPEIIYKECKVKIKQLGKTDENTTLFNLNSIGF